MRYNVFCKRKSLRVGWITFEAETPERAAEMARARGLDVELVKRAGEVHADDSHATSNVRHREHHQASEPLNSPPRGVMTKVVGCLAGVIVVVAGLAIVIAMNLPDLKSASVLRGVVSAAPPKPVCRCGEPIRWYIAELDSRYNITHMQARRAVERAAALWQREWGDHALFVYDAAGEMPIYLRFDENLHALKQQRDEHDRRLNEYNRAVTQYNYETARHDREVEQWNSRQRRGTEAEYNRLEGERARLGRERDRLWQEERAIERIRPRGFAQEHIYGHYSEQVISDPVTGNVIRITDREVTVRYFHDLDHLAFIVAHELGHALLGDTEHLDDPAALMHATPEFPEDGLLRLSESDRAALWAVCGEPRQRGR